MALEWIDRYGDCDGDGFIEYKRRTDGGLATKAGKTPKTRCSMPTVTSRGTIALCEVQGYVYRARLLAAQMAQDLGGTRLSVRLRRAGDPLQEQFEESFWEEELGNYVLALDGDKRPCRVRSSNAGQLFFGVLPRRRAVRMAQRLLLTRSCLPAGEFARQLARVRYNPASYHNGSVWPHDNALIALGLARYGRATKCRRSRRASSMRPPYGHAAFAGIVLRLARRQERGPTLYPIACSPQAWAAAAPMALLQACLGMEIDGATRCVLLKHPRMPSPLEWVRVRHLAVGDSRVDLLFRRHGDDVAVNILERVGKVDVQVVL